jgi:hypothetical protein
MSTIHLHRTTTLTPEQYIAALTDFGPGRSEVFPNSADAYLKVHRSDCDTADVTEGSGGIWERLHYDWSDPERVVLTTTDSNTWGGASGHTYVFKRRGRRHDRHRRDRRPRRQEPEGAAARLRLGTVGRGVLEKAFERSSRWSRRATQAAGGQYGLGQSKAA